MYYFTKLKKLKPKLFCVACIFKPADIFNIVQSSLVFQNN